MSTENKYIEENWDEDMQSVCRLADRLRMQERIDVDKNWKSLHYRLSQKKKRHGFFYWTQRIAAVLLLPALILSASLYSQLDDMRHVKAVECESTTAYGVHSKLLLADGTEVWLNSGSTLSYPKAFTDNRRIVNLRGEAFFKVKSDSSHPFDVRTNDGIQVTAYGTEFNVRAYDEEEDVRATLSEGVIEMRDLATNNNQVLKKGEQALYSRVNKNIEKKVVNVKVETAWKDGKMVFKRTPMREVVKILSRQFNVEIVLQDKELVDYSYSATFGSESLSEILSLLEATAPIQCTVIDPKQQPKLSFSKKKVYISLRN